MTKKQFWQSASNWGLIAGAALFVVNLIGLALKLETQDNAGFYELLLFAVICPLIVYTGHRNARLALPAEGYGYGRAVGYVLATMMFAGIVYGVGKFLLTNYIAPDYYDALYADAMSDFSAGLRAAGGAMQTMPTQEAIMDMLRNPFILIISSVIELVAKGGFLALVLCAFFAQKPDIFASTPAPTDTENSHTTDNSRTDE